MTCPCCYVIQNKCTHGELNIIQDFIVIQQPNGAFVRIGSDVPFTAELEHSEPSSGKGREGKDEEVPKGAKQIVWNNFDASALCARAGFRFTPVPSDRNTATTLTTAKNWTTLSNNKTESV